MQKLTSKIAALTERSEQTEVSAVELNQTSFRPQQRFVKPTPQNQQRNNYARDYNTRTPQGNATGFSSGGRVNNNPNEPECDRCGLHHATNARCIAQGQQCRNCQKFNHFSRKCRSARRQLPQQSPAHPQNQQ